jgi:zinc protease
VKSVSFARATLYFASLVFVASSGGCRTAGGVGSGAQTTVAPVAMGGSKTRAESRLDNGVAVIIEENHAAPVVAIQVWVAAGAADDPPPLAGASHLYEHLLFRGTRHRAPGAAAQEIEAAGGTLGAWTGLDETVFHVAVAAPFLDLGLDVLADALTGPTFDSAELERERKLVLGEIARDAASPARAGSEALRAAAFAGEAYGRPLLGTAAAVAARTPVELLARFAETYVGANLTVVVVGDVDARAAQAAVARAFAAVPRGRPMRRAPPSAPAATRARVVVSKSALTAPELVIGFRLAAPSAEESAALDLLAALLARGDGGRLSRELVHNRALAGSVRGFTFESRGGALLALDLSPAPRRLEAAAQAAVDEALRLAREDAPVEELARARAAVEGDLVRGDEGVEGHARRLGFAAAVAGDLEYGARYRARLEAISPGELRSAAAKLLRADAITLAVLDPATGASSTDPGAAGRLETMLAETDARAERQRVAEVPVDLSGDVVRFVAPSGVRILVLRDASAPSVTVEAAWAGGARAEDAASDGAAAFIAALLARGTRTRSATEIAAETQALGGSLSGFSDGSHLGLRAELLSSGWERGLALVADCLLHPAFAGDEVDAQRRVLLDRARIAGDDGAHAAWQLFREALWPQHPFRFDPVGAPEALASLGRVRLLDHYRRRYPPSQLVLTVVGDVQPGPVVSTLTALFAETSPGAPAPAPLPEPAHTEPVAVFRATGKDVTEVVLGYPGAAPRDPDRLAVEVLAELLAADGGRLKSALGGAPPLAYRINVSAARGVEPGYLAIAMACSPARVDAAVAALRAALARVAAGGVAADEVSRAARRRAGAEALGLRGKVAIADALALDEAYGLGLMSYRQVPAALAGVTADQVARAARRFLDPQREVIAVVRPPDPRPLARAASGGR